VSKDGASVISRNGAGTLAPALSAGESTLLKILSRIAEPTSGLVEIHGRVGSLHGVGDAAFQ
jgi:lipopolysaccharide transport system ATP-binding protein